MDFDPGLFVKPVSGTPDTFAFQFGFAIAPEGKATDAVVIDPDAIAELDDGDLLIEGWAANFEGLDRQDENFTDGAFKRGIKAFLANGGPLCYHHKHDVALGSVLALEEVEGKGLKMKARVDKQEPASPHYHLYNGVRKGTLKGLSVGGFFKRKLTDSGYKICDMDFTEISVTPVPVHPQTSFSVIAGKALESEENLDPTEDKESEALKELNRAAAALTALVETVEGKALPKKHNPSVARGLRRMLDSLGGLRTISTDFRTFGEEVKSLGLDADTKPEETLGAFADGVESQCVQWEADVHRLSAKFGPLPIPDAGLL